ncbi:MAG: type III-A CRISPR-associated protein Cas10/Csm1 [Anaerolineae bacterium]|nr:type III-A CRISPR-associated protein Cas10/Csm1 [Anaerolineae bacterium]
MKEHSEERERIWLAALAGLLHDVGKFAQRAGWRTGKHTDVGADFVSALVPQQWRRALYPVMGHHDQPLQGYETKVVALADRLSAGERADERQEQPRQLLTIFCRLETSGRDGNLQRAPSLLYWPLRPLALERETLFPQVQCSEQEVIQGYQTLWQDFQAQADHLLNAHSGNGHLEVYLESLLLTMQRYTWCIPSAYYRSLPDVSLYDHSRMAAALAACLTGTSEPILDSLLTALDEWYQARRQAEQQERDPATVAPPDIMRHTQPVLLVGGDISGVQDFIYTISSQGATSGLRGRSFYLQLLTEVVARYVLRRLGLPITNLIYQGGGAFYLLARAGDKDELLRIQQEVSRVLLAHHRGDLYLALAYRPLTVADFYDGRLSNRWEELASLLREVKQRRFAELGAEVSTLFEPQGHGGNQAKECQVCGREHPETRESKGRPEDESGTRKCPQCESYEELGDKLRRARYLAVADQKPSIPDRPLEETPGQWNQVLAALGYYCDVAEDPPRLPDSNYRVILALKDEALKSLRPEAQTAVGRRFLVNVTPVYEKIDADWLSGQPSEVRRRLAEDLPERPGFTVKPFSLLEAQSQGIERLGVLRMDLDDGGRLFSDGFVERDGNGQIRRRFATLSRVAALSFAISLYFEGWVEHIAEEMNAGTRAARGDTLYSIYSGGDDLFFVGAWDRVVELARRIRADLTPFAAYHPGVHASAGIVLVSGKYPLYQAAAEAGEAEKQAKGWAGKDALAFLGQVVSWQKFGLDGTGLGFMESVSALTRRLVRMVTPEKEGGEGVPQALVRRLIRLQELYEDAAAQRRALGQELNRAGEEQVYWGPWMWRGYYFLKRMTRHKTGEPWDSINQLAEGLRGDHFSAIEWIGLAARWAELLTRR